MFVEFSLFPGNLATELMVSIDVRAVRLQKVKKYPLLFWLPGLRSWKVYLLLLWRKTFECISTSLILHFCSQFWLCYHVLFNPLDQTWQMVPWQKEGGLRINHSGVPLSGSWLRALGRNAQFRAPVLGISWCFQQREIQLSVIWHNFGACRKMFNTLPFWPFVDYSLA